MAIITRDEYSALRARIDHYEATRSSLYPGVCCFSQEMIANIVTTAGVDRAPTNEERNAIEVFEWNNSPPARYFAYVNEQNRTVTTWMGEVLGKVEFGRPFRDNLGGVRVNITVRATNGKVYHGTYYKSSGDYCRLKLKKTKVKG